MNGERHFPDYTGPFPDEDFGELSATDRLYADILKKDAETYINLEAWGSLVSIFAIGTLAKQLVEWASKTGSVQDVALQPCAYALPALVGLVAFSFLRIVNHRLHHARTCLLLLAGSCSWAAAQPGSFDLLGWTLALMPMGLGYVASWYFISGSTVQWNDAVPIFSYAGLLLLSAACLWYTRNRRRLMEV